ncbi:MAG: secreted dehydrogenase, partial [Actinomycetia bacterium]|nr:secreted dehydrogenase [Actinomycetes bacterium]
EGRGRAAVAEIAANGGTATFVAHDLAGVNAAALATAATSAVGRPIDVLVNNAGIFGAPPTLHVDEATFDCYVDVNVKAPFFLTAALVPGMVELGAGSVVNIGSWVASRGVATAALYSSTKAALEQLTRAWAAEFGPSGIRVNAVAPGVTLTEGTQAAEDRLRAMVEPIPAGRFGLVDEVADAAVFLAGRRSSFIHGVVLAVDGGRLAI